MPELNALELIKRIKSISETGLIYAESDYDRERYEELSFLSLELLGIVSSEAVSALEEFFMPVKDYPTPKVDIRGFAVNDAKEILFVKEAMDGKWSLPGGWADIGFSPSEVIVKEIREETGLHSKVSRLLAVYDKKCHPHPPQPFYVYKLVFLCEIEGGDIRTGFDIEGAEYFDIDDLPALSEDRILESQIRQLYRRFIHGDKTVYFD